MVICPYDIHVRAPTRAPTTEEIAAAEKAHSGPKIRLLFYSGRTHGKNFRR